MKPSKNQPKEQIDKLEQALARAHAAQEAPQLSTAWIYAIMRDIRQLGERRRTIEMPQLMWRAATVVAFLSMLVVGSVLAWDAQQSDGGFAGLFTETTVEASLL